MKLRIAVWHNLPSGGGKRALYYHVKGLVERGHHVEIWCPPTADRSFLPLEDLAPEHVVPLAWRYASPGEGVLRFYRRTRKNLSAMDEHCRVCAHQMAQGRFDILFANSCMFFRTPPIGRHISIPRVLYLQEPYRWLYEALPQLPWIAIPDPKRAWWTPRYLRWFLRDLVRVQAHRVQAREELVSAKAFDRILVNSYFSRESVLRAYGVEAQTCYLGIDTQKFRDLGLERQPFVLSVGALIPEKNPMFILQAIGAMSPPRPPLVWVANHVHSDAYLNELNEYAGKHGVTFEVKTCIDDEELLILYNTASVMVYTPRLEPFGYAPLEANACGLPVVAVAEGGVRETISHGVNGLLVDGNPQLFAKAVERLLCDRSYAQQLGSNGRAVVEERWSLESSVRRLEEHLLKAVEAVRVSPQGADHRQ